MKKMMIVAAAVALGACGGGGAKNNTTSTTTTTNTVGTAQTAPNAAAPAAQPPAAQPPAANSSASGADAEIAAGERSNIEQATADARNISSERDPDARAATCIVFLGISRDAGNSAGGFDDAAMRQAQDQWKADLRQRMSEQEMNQLTGSSVNMLMPAERSARDTASAWCVRNAPEVDPEG